VFLEDINSDHIYVIPGTTPKTPIKEKQTLSLLADVGLPFPRLRGEPLSQHYNLSQGFYEIPLLNSGSPTNLFFCSPYQS